MKRTIFIEFLLLVALILTIHFNYYFWNSVKNLKELINIYTNDFGNDYSSVVQSFNDSLKSNTNHGILALVSSLLLLTSIIFIAIKDFPVFKPFVDKVKAKSEARKAERNTLKVQKAEENKQAKIKALEEQLEELKKN